MKKKSRKRFIVPGRPDSYRQKDSGRKKARDLTPDQIKAAKIFAYTSSPQTAGEAVGVGPSTVRKWYKGNAQFRRLVRMESRFLADKYLATEENVVSELAKLGFTNLSDVAEWDDEGLLKVKGSLKIDPRARAAIAEIQEEVTKDGKRKLRIKMHDKKGSLDSLGRKLGIFKDKIETDHKGELVVRSVSYADVPTDNPLDSDPLAKAGG